jgi:hypothetical protein
MPLSRDKAQKALEVHAFLATALANGELPQWFNFIFAAVRLIPLNKGETRPGETPDVRPVGISCALRRALTRCIFAEEGLRSTLRSYLAPTQLAVYVPGGPTKLIFAIRELLDAHDDFCVVNIDLKNAFNCILRAALLREVLSVPELVCLAPLFHSLLAPKSPILSGSGEFVEQVDFLSEEGVQQGSVEGPVAFAIGISRLLKALDAELNLGCGGAARAGADDVSAIGVPSVVFPAVRRFADALLAEFNLEANAVKTVCWGRPEHAAELDAHRGGVPLGCVADAAGGVHLGVTVYGIPLGSKEYIATVLASKCDRIAGTSQKLITSLGQSHKQPLWTLTFYSTRRKGDYWAQHCFPEDCLDFCRRFDDIIYRQAEVALGCSPLDDWLAGARMRLPPRLGGIGLHSLVQLSPAAFWGAASRAVASFLDVHDERGAVLFEGTLERPSVVARVGRGAFADGGGGWQQFYASGSRLGAELLARWGELGAQVPVCYTGDLRVLKTPAAEVRPSGGGLRLQADITADLEQLKHEELHAALCVRPGLDRQRQIFLNTGRESALFVTVIPGSRTWCPNEEWVECTARLLGLPSPVCASLVGSAVPAARNRAPQPLDRFGDVLAAATTFQGHGFARLQHDPVVRMLARFGAEYGCTTATAEDSDTFGSVLRAHPAHLRTPGAVDRTRVATVDLRVALDRGGALSVDHLVEMKTVHFGPSHYGGAAPVHNAAVERRVAGLPAERRAQLVATDREVFGVLEGQVGPLEARLNAFPEVLGIATGAFHEWSQSLVGLIQTFADMGASAWQAKVGAPSPEAARSALLWRMRGELSMCVARGHAKLLIQRARALPSQAARRMGGAPGVRAARGAPAGPHYADGLWGQRRECGGSPRRGCGGAPRRSPAHARGRGGGRRAAAG